MKPLPQQPPEFLDLDIRNSVDYIIEDVFQRRNVSGETRMRLEEHIAATTMMMIRKHAIHTRRSVK